MKQHYRVNVRRNGQSYFTTQPIDCFERAVSIAEDMQVVYGHDNVTLWHINATGNGVAKQL